MRKRKLFSTLLLTTILVLTVSIAASAGRGAVWTTKNDCGLEQQDVNHFNVGDAVFINGAGFDPGAYEWEIRGKPGGASGHPGEVVRDDTVTIGNGGFCFNAYTIQAEDWGEYGVKVGDVKGDNYRVSGQPTATVVPTEPTKTSSPTLTVTSTLPLTATSIITSTAIETNTPTLTVTSTLPSLTVTSTITSTPTLTGTLTPTTTSTQSATPTPVCPVVTACATCCCPCPEATMSEAEATREWLEVTEVAARIEADTELALILKEGALFESVDQLNPFFKIGIGVAIASILGLVVYLVIYWFSRRKQRSVE